MVLSIKVKLRTEMFDTVMESRYGQTVLSTKDIGVKVSQAAKEDSITLTEMSMKVRYF